MTYRLLFSALVIGAGLLLFSACKTGSKIPVLSETECLGAGNNGSIRLKAWGYGNRTNEATEQCKRNAVYDVLFKGIKAGSVGCSAQPLVPQGPEKKPAYFEDFFQDNGPYLRYVSLSGDGSIRPEDRIRVGKKYKVGMFVLLDHQQLRQKLQADGLVPKLTDGF